MNRQEFDAIVNDSVKNGNDRASAEAYVIAGYKLEGKPAAEKNSSAADGKTAAASSSKKPAAKKAAAKKE